VTLIYMSVPQHALPDAMRSAQRVDPGLFYVVDRARSWSRNLDPVVGATGWRGVAKKK